MQIDDIIWAYIGLTYKHFQETKTRMFLYTKATFRIESGKVVEDLQFGMTESHGTIDSESERVVCVQYMIV